MIRNLTLVGWLILSVVLKIPSWVHFCLVIITILASLVFRIGGVEGFALRLMTYAYGFAVIGAASLLREIRKDV